MLKFDKQIILIFLLPIITGIILYIIGYSQISIPCSYLVWLLVLSNIDIKHFLLEHLLKNYWNIKAIEERKFMIQNAIYNNNVLTTSAKNILDDKNLDSFSKTKTYTVDTTVFINGLRDDIKKSIFINVFVILGSLILLNSTPSAGGEEMEQWKINFINSSKIILSYIAAIVQAVYFITLIFVYRGRNNRLHSELTAFQL